MLPIDITNAYRRADEARFDPSFFFFSLQSFDVYTDLIITVLSPELVSVDASAHAHERSNPVSSIFGEIAVIA